MTKYARTSGGNWSSDSTWSSTSGGSADTVAPTAADDILLDVNSGNVTIDAASVCRSLNCTGYVGTLTHNAFTLTIGDTTGGLGNVAIKLVSGMTYTLANVITSAISFISTSATQQAIDFAGLTTGNVTFNASSNGSWLYAGEHLMGATATLTLTQGTLNTGGYNCSWGIFSSSNTNIRTLTLKTSKISILSTAATTIWNIGTATNMTLNASESIIVIANTTTNIRIFSPGAGFIYGTLNYIVAGSTGRLDFFTSHTWNTINFWDATNARAIRWQAGTTITITGMFNVNGSASKLVTMDTTTGGSAIIINKASGVVSNDYLSLKDCTFSGGARWFAGTHSTNTSGNTGITFTAPVLLMEDLKEDFEFGGIDDGKWSSSGSSQVVIGTALNLQMTSALAGNYIGYNSIATKNLTGSYAFIQLVDAGNQSIPSWEVYPIYLFADTNNKIFIRIATNSVQAIKVVAGVTTNVGSPITYNPSTMKWFRIRESAGQTYFEYATDPTATWTAITANIANPITVTALTVEMLIGTWEAESSITTAIFDNFNVTPGQNQFTWKGLVWNKRIHAANASNNQTWSSDNIVVPNSDDYIKLRLSNNGAAPIGCEIFSAKRGFGYGTYTMVVATELDNVGHPLAFGGMFTFDFTAPPDYKEIDVNETRDYNSNTNKRILKNHVWNNAGSRVFITDDMDVPTTIIQTHRLIWTPTGLTFDSFLGQGIGGTNYFNAVHSTHLPTPGLERVHFNTFVDPSITGFAAVNPVDIIIRDFSFVPAGRLSHPKHPTHPVHPTVAFF